MVGKRALQLILGAMGLGVGAYAVAQVVDLPTPTLHEYVPPPPGGGRIVDGAARQAPQVIGAPPSSGQNPTAIRDHGKLLPEPDKSPTKSPDEPIHGRHGFAADRDTQATPDRVTGADRTLHYVEVFNPAIVPFKRMSAMDAVRDEYTLYVYEQALVDLPVGGDTQADRDLFWGSLMLELSPGEEVAIPSVAADMRILSYELEPALDAVFSKDGADNYYVRSDDTRADGKYRLVFLVDAPAAYFASPVPPGLTVYDAAASGLVRPVPAQAQRAAVEVEAHIGVNRNQPLDVVVDKLIAYFRSFEAGAPPPDTGDVYRDLAFSQVGVCRHRAFAFVITANHLGIPARYVTNEAHAFAEIWIPGGAGNPGTPGQWVRVDLGGAALELEVSNAADKQMYRPRADDPFPKPKPYAENYTRMNGDIQGLTQDQIDDLQRGADPNDPFGNGNGSNGNGSTDPVSPAPGTGLPLLPDSAYAGKSLTDITVDSADAVGYRGDGIRVRGHVMSGGAPLGGVGVDIYFAPAGLGGDGARALGQTATAADGSYSYTVDLPRDLPLGEYEVFAATSGDRTHAPSLSK